MSLLCYWYFIIIFYILHSNILYQSINVNEISYSEYIVNCILKPPLSYSLKMASWKPKHVADVFFELYFM